MSDMVMCEKIRKARISEGLSQADLALAAEMNTDTIISIEAGTVKPE
ncbi:MAG: helix-turn-helix transcriptional regulator, partial [Blautia sp.]|nr:helix-turn-helix transcriptional regulator [Blautia sp.]